MSENENRRKVGADADEPKVAATRVRNKDKEAKELDLSINDNEGALKDQSAEKKRSIVPVVVLILIIGAAVGILFGVMQSDNLKNPFAPEKAIAEVLVVDDGTVYDGITCMGVDLAGATKGDAEKQKEIDAAAQEIINGIKYDIKISDKYTVTVDGATLDAAIDTSSFLDEAYEYGRTGSIQERKDAIDKAASGGHDIDYELTYSVEKAEKAVEDKLIELGAGYKDATFEVVKHVSEENRTTGLDVNFVEGSDGIKVDSADLSALLKEKIDGREYSATLEPKTEVTKPEITVDDLQDLYCKQGTFKTTYGSSNSNRRYNIWKMASIIDGVVIEPGETWSINEEAGPRTYSRGWKAAAGISNGQYEQEAGGGICQVSTTLYNACMRTEITIVDRSHHSWPSDYVDPGLDATISTGSPDFKIKNPYDTPIIICAECDASDAYIQVSIYCPKMDYKLDFTSDVVSRSYSGARRTISDSSLPAGTEQMVIKEHPKVVVNVYKHKYDLEGNKIGEAELYYTDTYANKPAVYRVGTGAAKPAETTPAETTPGETTPAETTPAETTPAETTPAETTPAETKPAETTPAETKPAETKPAETKPDETKPDETKPAETTAQENSEG